MLVTFSGMVGSGKTTNAKKTLKWLDENGRSPYYLRFRFIRWKHLLNAPSKKPPNKHASSHSKREANSKTFAKPRIIITKQLTVFLLFGYLMRVLRFRLLLRLHYRGRTLVVNRYFYDNLARFRLAKRRERFYLRLLLTAIPKPDLAFMMSVQPETASRRRPAYQPKELCQLAHNYHQMQKRIRHLTIIQTDDLKNVDQQVKRKLMTAFGSVPVYRTPILH